MKPRGQQALASLCSRTREPSPRWSSGVTGTSGSPVSPGALECAVPPAQPHPSQDKECPSSALPPNASIPQPRKPSQLPHVPQHKPAAVTPPPSHVTGKQSLQASPHPVFFGSGRARESRTCPSILSLAKRNKKFCFRLLRHDSTPWQRADRVAGAAGPRPQAVGSSAPAPLLPRH